MNALTSKAGEIVRQMLSAGWQVKFNADQVMPAGEWEFSKIVGECWAIGIDADIEKAAAEAMKNAKDLSGAAGQEE